MDEIQDILAHLEALNERVMRHRNGLHAERDARARDRLLTASHKLAEAEYELRCL